MLVNKKDLDFRMQQSFGSWTNNKTFQYRLTYKCEDYQPHCTYIMQHDSTEAASKVKLDHFTDTLGEGLWKFTANETLVTLVTPSQEYKNLSAAFYDALHLYSSVVPSALVREVRTDLKVATSQLELVTENFEATQALLTLNSFHKVVEKLADIECRYQVDINKVTQRNDICYSHTKAALNELDFISKQNIEQSDFCLYGKSMIDMYFYKDCGATVNSAVIKKLENYDDKGGHEFGVVGGLAEFKSDGGNMKRHCAQIFADMVRVGTLLACSALVRGKIVEKIVVYGLLVDYKTSLAIITKYYVNFLADETTFFVGEEVSAVKGLVSIVQTMKTMC